MTTYFTSDSHFQHARIIELGEGRPFSTIEEHDAALIANWNRRVNPEDLVYHLGDFAMGDRKNVPAIRAKLNGDIILIKGNHDNNKRGELDSIFRLVLHSTSIVLDGYHLHLQHSPNSSNPWDKDSRDWNEEVPPGFDFYLHGHVHTKWARQGKHINVGVDVRGFQPVTLQELINA